MPKHPKLPEQAFTLYDQFAHGRINRRAFLSGLGKLSVGALTTSIMLDALMPNYALAEQVSFNDPDIIASYQEFSSPDGYGTGKGYRVEPSKLDKPAPLVLVIHENRGLNPYIKDVARRFAKQGFIAFAPDGLYPVGGYPGNDEQGKKMQASMDKDKLANDFFAAAKSLKGDGKGNGKLGVIGFCYGGGMVNKIVTEAPDLADAAVPFYGAAPDLAKVKNIQAPLMIQMGELDEWVNAMWPDYEKALKTANKDYQAFVYPGARHGFHNDSTARYDQVNAELAWQRTLAFFNQHLA
ncbi:dienelactone hydrolase family protein [Neptunicella sp. SCSIO 80796]|uniref:dienelactone hydrolase family protein n=1 Tax=Neptunicella plasticusilytica TaxID=3117012 RepID=UPI003A4DD56B